MIVSATAASLAPHSSSLTGTIVALAPELVKVLAVNWLGRDADLDDLKKLVIRQQDGIFCDHWWGFFRGLLIFFCALHTVMDNASQEH